MLRSYLLIAWKVLLRNKAHTAISLFGITFTLLALVVVAALVDHGLGPVGPEGRRDRILVAGGAVAHRDFRYGLALGPRLLDRFFRDLPGAQTTSILLEASRVGAYRDGARIDLALKRTDAGFWQILTFSFVEGGAYSVQDVAEARPAVVISEGTRKKLFDGAPALGRWLELSGQRFQVVGVVRDISPLHANAWADLWAPLTTSRLGHHLLDLSPASDADASAIVLAAPGADSARMQQEAALRASRYDPPDARHGRAQVSLKTSFARLIDGLDRGLFGRGSPVGHLAQLSRLTLAALGMSLLFMLLPAVNLINLNVSRILERAPEIGVRKAFGASSRTLVGQFVVENVVLTTLGGGLALLLSTVVLGRVRATGLLGDGALAVSYRVFLVGLGLALLFGLVSGVYPAWKMARLHPLSALRGAVR